MRKQPKQNKTPNKTRRLLVWTAVLCVLFAMAGCAFFGVFPRVTRVVCGDEHKTVLSLTADPARILAKTAFAPEKYDKVNLDDFSEALPFGSIRVERHSKDDLGVVLEGVLENEPLQQAVFELAQQARQEALKQTVKVQVICDGKTQTVKTHGTVADALAAAGVILGPNDTVTRPLDDALQKGMKLRVRRVAFRETAKKKKIAFPTEEMPTDTLYLGEGQVLQEGQSGERTIYYLEKTVDGKVKSRLKLGEAVTKEPLSEVLLIGVKTGLIPKGSVGVSGLADRPAISELPAALDIPVDVNGKPVNYKKKLVGEATAYSGGGGTSTGYSVLPGRVAVDPREIPYGTKMYIVSTDGQYIYGYAEARDTGGFIHTSDTMVDLYMHRESDCERFGRRNVEIYILE